jgi:hypothetical protein
MSAVQSMVCVATIATLVLSVGCGGYGGPDSPAHERQSDSTLKIKHRGGGGGGGGAATLGTFQISSVSAFGATFFVTKGHDACGGRDYVFEIVDPGGTITPIRAHTACPWSTAFAVSVRGMKPSTAYTVTMELASACGTAPASAPETLTTLEASPEQNAPVLGMLSSGFWFPPIVSVTVKDDSALDRVELRMDGVLESTTSWAAKGIHLDYGTGYGETGLASVAWPSDAHGDHGWEARAFDVFGNEAATNAVLTRW